MAKKKKAATFAAEIPKADCNTPALKNNEIVAEILTRCLDVTARIVEENLSAKNFPLDLINHTSRRSKIASAVFMSAKVAVLCNKEKIFIDEVEDKFLQKFFKTFLTMWEFNKEITFEILQNIFFKMYRQQKLYNRKYVTVHLACDIACCLCVKIYALKQNAAQDWREF